YLIYRSGSNWFVQTDVFTDSTLESVLGQNEWHTLNLTQRIFLLLKGLPRIQTFNDGSTISTIECEDYLQLQKDIASWERTQTASRCESLPTSSVTKSSSTPSSMETKPTPPTSIAYTNGL